MKELSLHILDIAQNSLLSEATLIVISLTENRDTLEVSVSDNGCGIKREFLKHVSTPHFTTRKAKNGGMGLALFRQAAEKTGGSFSIESKCASEYSQNRELHGTLVRAVFYKSSPEYVPLGDIVPTLICIIQALNQNANLLFSHIFKVLDKSEKSESGKKAFLLDTRDIRSELGDISLSEPEILMWLKEYLNEKYNNIISKVRN